MRFALFVSFSLSALTLAACSSEPDADDSSSFGSGGAVGTGGAPSGGAASGGTSSGGASTGGATTGGAASGGQPASGGTATGGAQSGGAASGGDASGGEGPMAGGSPGSGGESSGSGGASSDVFALSSPAWDALDNDDCSPETSDVCPLYPQANVSTMIGGDNLSPEMSWTSGPEGTQSYALVLHDLVNGFGHWALFDIPLTTTMLPAGLPAGELADGSKQAGFNGADASSAYFGSGACGNVYEFRLFALDVPTLEGSFSGAGAVRDLLESSDAVLAETFVRLQSRDYCN